MSSNTFTLPLKLTPGRWAAVMVLGVTLLAGSLAVSGEEPLQITSDPSVVSVKLGDQPVLEYQYVGKPKKPYAKEWFSPQGVNVLRDAPHDHLHHHGLMFAVAVDGVDFWSENETCGREKHVRLADVHAYSRHGLSWGTFTQHVDWLGPDAETVLLKEVRTIDSCRLAGATLLVWQSRFDVPAGKSSVTLSGSTYFGLGMRFVESMDKGGRFQNADGNSGVEGTNDAQSAWCAYSAAADGKPVTVAMFDCPANARYPATWFTMDSAFAYLSATLNLSKEPLVISSGDPLELRYAVALWDGHVDSERIEKLYRQLGAWFSQADVQSAGAELFVAPNGSDENSGTEQQPFATLARARDAVRQRVAAGLKADLTVHVREGTYRLGEPLVFGPEDSGTGEHAITYAAYAGEKVVVSGGWPVTGWTKGQGEVWTAPVPGVKEGELYFRHLFVDGRRALRARTPNKDDENPCRQLTGAELAGDLSRYTLTVPGGLLGEWSNPTDIEVMVAGNWAINRLPVQSIDRQKNMVVLAPPHAQGHRAICPGPGRWFCFENAPEMLDQPGEWYLDRATGLLSYWPLPGEDMASLEVIAPVVSRLVEVKGTPEKPVRNLHFQGIRFEHTDLALPDGGYLGIQACHRTVGTDWKRPWARVPAAIRWDYVEHSSIEDGAMAHLGGCGVELVAGCHDNLIQGNHVFDVSGNGIMLGGPKSEAEAPKRNRIANNHVHACGVEYYGAIGIWVGFAQQAVVAHNLVHDLPYSGISVGWQWNPEPTPCKENLIENNHVYDVMNRLCDGGCLYTLGFQPGAVIRANHFHDAHRSRYAQGAPNNGMFIDEGSKGYLFEQNVIYNTSAGLVRFNQCQRDWHTWRDNHIGEAAEVKESGKDIIANAGLEPPYRGRLMGDR